MPDLTTHSTPGAGRPARFDPLEDLPEDALEDRHAPPVREGLPPGFRMRADSHYVDQLEAARPAMQLATLPLERLDAATANPVPALVDSIRRHGLVEPVLVQRRGERFRVLAGTRRVAAARAAGLREVPCLVWRVDDSEADALAEAVRSTARAAAPVEERPITGPSTDHDVLATLTAITTCTGLVTPDFSALTRRIATDLIRAESWRSSCLVYADRVIREGLPPGRGRVRVKGLLGRVLSGCATECRLRGVRVDTVLSLADDVTVSGNEETLMFVLAGLVLMTVELLDRAAEPRLQIAALPEPQGRITLAISQDSAPVPVAWPSVVDEVSASRPQGGLSTPVAMLALRRIVDAHGGLVSTARFANGCRLLVELPTGQA